MKWAVSDYMPVSGGMKAVAVNLSQKELEALQGIADEYGVARNAVMRHFMRFAIAAHRRGKTPQVKMQVEIVPAKNKVAYG